MNKKSRIPIAFGLCFSVLALVLSHGCSESASIPRLDMSSPKASERSMREVRDSLSGEQLAMFDKAIAAKIMRESLLSMLKPNEKDADLIDSFKRDYHGLTGAEVIELHEKSHSQKESIGTIVDNDARYLASASQQYYLEENVNEVIHGYDPKTGTFSKPISIYFKKTKKDYTITPSVLKRGETFTIDHPDLAEPLVYNDWGIRVKDSNVSQTAEQLQKTE